MKSLMSLWIRLAEESADRCCTSATEDINTVLRRTEHEGLSFLTITLPDFGKAIEKWLDLGQAGIHPSFTRGRGGLPRFLGGFLNRVFDRSNGSLLDEPCIDSIIALRQLTLVYGKLSLRCTPRREREAMRKFVECELDVRQSDMNLSQKDLTDFQNMSDMLFQEVFAQVDRDIYYGHILPKHGPGSVADKLSSNGKFVMRNWTRRLEGVFPSYEYLIPNGHFTDHLNQVNIHEPGAELPVKVISVPKTLKTPRIIAIEPACMQYAQQAILRVLLDSLKRDELLSGMIGFDDQIPNQEMAKRGSIDNRTATLDLSDASDRVSNQLVRAMVRNWPNLSKAIDGSRSRKAVVRGHGVIRLAKFASMGSGLCFPMEAFVFTTLVFLGIQRSLNVTMSRSDVSRFRESVRIYGDDLIVPVDHVRTIVQTLELFGAQVGLHKSFWTGRFRESCGKEYFNGVDVSLVRCRQALPTTMADVTGVIATVALRNQLYEHGYWRTVRWLDKQLKDLLRYYPTVAPTSPVLGRVSFLGYQSERTHPFLHSPQVRGYVVQAKAPNDPLGGTGALLKCLLKLETGGSLRGVGLDTDKVPCYRPSLAYLSERTTGSFLSGLPPGRQDEKHLERSGRPKHVSIKLGWGSPF